MLRKDRFDEREMDFYEALYTQSQAQVRPPVHAAPGAGAPPRCFCGAWESWPGL